VAARGNTAVLSQLLKDWAPPADVLKEAVQHAAADEQHAALELLYRQLRRRGLHVGLALPQACLKMLAVSEWMAIQQQSAEQQRARLQQQREDAVQEGSRLVEMSERFRRLEKQLAAAAEAEAAAAAASAAHEGPSSARRIRRH
jgi:hypothetical protein